MIGQSRPEMKQGKPVNFAYQDSLYMLYDRDFKCVYVGVAVTDPIQKLNPQYTAGSNEEPFNVRNLILPQGGEKR